MSDEYYYRVCISSPMEKIFHSLFVQDTKFCLTYQLGKETLMPEKSIGIYAFYDSGDAKRYRERMFGNGVDRAKYPILCGHGNHPSSYRVATSKYECVSMELLRLWYEIEPAPGQTYESNLTVPIGNVDRLVFLTKFFPLSIYGG